MILFLKLLIVYFVLSYFMNMIYKPVLRFEKRLKLEGIKQQKKRYQESDKRKLERKMPLSVQKLLVKAGWEENSDEVLKFLLIFYLITGVYLFISSRHWVQFFLFEMVIIFVPYFFLRFHIYKRQTQFSEQLSAALVMMANSLESGFSFEQSLQTLSKEMSDPIAGEFTKILKQNELGVSTENALLACAYRMDSEEMFLLEAAYSIQKRVGGNLAEIVKSLANNIQERQDLKNKIKTLSVQGRMSGLVIGALPIVILFAFTVVNPEYVNVLFTTPFGWKLLAVSLFLEFLGIFFIKKVITIE